MIVRRGDLSGLDALLLCNLSEKSLTLTVGEQSGRLALALYTGEETFGPTPSVMPPATIEKTGASVELASFTAALYLPATGKGTADDDR